MDRCPLLSVLVLGCTSFSKRKPSCTDSADVSVYQDYDIVIWSQTHWRWLETKLVELGILGGDANYKICFVLDRLPMFPVCLYTEAIAYSQIFAMKSDGSLYKHEVKPLDYIYHTFPQWCVPRGLCRFVLT